MKKLVTVRAEHSAHDPIWSHLITENIADLLLGLEDYREQYYIVNVVPISDLDAEKIDGKLSTM